MAMKCCPMFSTTEGEALLVQNIGQKPLNHKLIKQESNSETQNRTLYKSRSHAAREFEVMHSLRNDEVLCDIKLETDDGTIVHAHKIILASATPYFHTMFTNFQESKKEHVNLRELESTALKLLVDFIYTAQIMITEDNVQGLLHAANLLQLQDVKDACCDFLQTQINPANCLGFKALVSFYGCTEILSSFDYYIRQNFSEVVEGDEFLCLPFEQVVELISCNMIKVPSEKKVFECVIGWMNHNSDCKEEVLLKLLEHVRLPLISKEYLLKTIEQVPLLKNSLECTNYVMEAIELQLLKKKYSPNIHINVISTKPRQPINLHEIIVVLGFNKTDNENLFMEWYDPLTNQWKSGREIIYAVEPKNVLLNDGSLFLFDCYSTPIIVDLFLPGFVSKETESLSKVRAKFGLGVLDNCVYIVGGYDDVLNDTVVFRDGEVFNRSTQKWKKIARMSTPRHSLGVGVLNNHLYAIGGSFSSNCYSLKSVERYCPANDTWTTVADMTVRRTNVGVGTLNGFMYAVGGQENCRNTHSSVEVYNPKHNRWTKVACMNKQRINPQVVSLNNLLYVVGGDKEASVEIYNPLTDHWSILGPKMHIIEEVTGADVVNKPNKMFYE